MPKCPSTLGRHRDFGVDGGGSESFSPTILRVDMLEERVCCVFAELVLRDALGKNRPRIGVRGGVADEVATDPAGEADRKGTRKLQNEEGVCKRLEPRLEGVVVGVVDISCSGGISSSSTRS